MNFIQLYNLFKNHDWWHEKSDDLSKVYKGNNERDVIAESAKQFDYDQLQRLLDLFCPTELRDDWNRFLAKARETK